MKKKYRDLLFTAMFVLFVLAVKLIPIPSVDGYNRIPTHVVRTQVVKHMAIERVLKRYKSPLAPYTGTFISNCRRYNFNCYLLPSISGVESGFGHALIHEAKNPFGWGGGYIYFNTWEDGISIVANGLHKNYMLNGLTNPYLIAPVYAPPSHTWAGNVSMYMRIFEQEEAVIAKRFELFKRAGIM